MTQNPLKVLILEDEVSMNRGIAFSLERGGFQAIQVYSLEEAMNYLTRNRADIYICDITLPDGSGLDFVRAVRKKEEQGRPYVICLTALDTESDYVLGYEAGVDDYISKPFSLSVLMLKLEAYVRRLGSIGSASPGQVSASKSEENNYYSGDICFNTERMEVTSGGQPITLSKNEVKLLNVFMKHPKQILSKQQILEQAFDVYEKYIDENTLAVNISRLRDKLGDSAQNPRYIKNVRGLGYIWMQDVH